MWCISSKDVCQQRSWASVFQIKAVSPFSLPFLLPEVNQCKLMSRSDNKPDTCVTLAAWMGQTHCCYCCLKALILGRIIKDFTSRLNQSAFFFLYHMCISPRLCSTRPLYVLTEVWMNLCSLNNQVASCPIQHALPSFLRTKQLSSNRWS